MQKEAGQEKTWNSRSKKGEPNSKIRKHDKKCLDSQNKDNFTAQNPSRAYQRTKKELASTLKATNKSCINGSTKASGDGICLNSDWIMNFRTTHT